jgi:hypothetical protein
VPRRPHAAPTPHPARPGLVLPVLVDPRGLAGPTPNRARGPHWRRVAHGHHVPSAVPATPMQRVLEAAANLPAYGAVTGWGGLRWEDGHWFDGTTHGGTRTRPVTLAIGGSGSGRPGFGTVPSKERLRCAEVVEVDGVRVTVPTRSALFEMRYAASWRAAVEVADMAAYSDLVDRRELADALVEIPGWTGVPQAREAWAWMDENAWSPTEVRTRLLWRIDAELPVLLTNCPVFDRYGNHVATPDLLDVESGTAVDYDGRQHLLFGQRRKDVGRERALRSLGLEYLTVLASDLADRHACAAAMRRVWERAPREAERTRRWTVRPPRWWVPTTTVAQRRALAAEGRGHLLPPRRTG